MIKQEIIEELYIKQRKSLQEIAERLGCSVHTVVYWKKKYGIASRTISESVYLWANPKGDPFKYVEPVTFEDAKLFGLGIGIYWGEGTKANKSSVRVGNTDPLLIKKFMEFLDRFFQVNRDKLRFGLQLFHDSNVEASLRYWTKELEVSRKQFYKVTVSPSVSQGTYKRKSKFGVITVYFHNTKLRNQLFSLLPR